MDAIVIGSGIGGLATAGMLASVGNKRVLVLEKHTEPGGQTHAFRRDGASWDVGVHYVGSVAPGTLVRTLLDELSGGELTWNRMPEEFERFVYPGLDFAVPSDPEEYRRRLVAQFPAEERAIHRYFRDVHATARWASLVLARGLTPSFVDPLIGLLLSRTGTTATLTTGEYLTSRFASEQLRAVLASQWADYGLPPSRSAFAIHALIVDHYLAGGWFPNGGSAQIARTFEKGIEARGGAVRVAQEVTEILVRDGRAYGVRVMDRRGPVPREVIYEAPVVVSAVGARNTYDKLLPQEGQTGRLAAPERAKLTQVERGLSAVVLYLRLSRSATSIGVHGENFWINTSTDHDNVEGNSRGILAGLPEHIYLSFPSLKSGEERFHTAEIISTVDPEVFRGWRDRPIRNRGAEYAELKQTIAEGLIDLADIALPGFADLVSYAELSTPLSVEHYTSHPGGEFYGVAATPERYRSGPFGPQTPIRNLYLAGEDAGSLGIAGAMLGGVGAAARILGAAGSARIMARCAKGMRRAGGGRAAGSAAAPAGSAVASAGSAVAGVGTGVGRPAVPAIPGSTTGMGDKRPAMLAEKNRLTESTWHVTYELVGPVGEFAPGQFARVLVGNNEWRDYSIARAEGRRLELLISTATGGHGSRFVTAAAPGTRTQIELPLGEFTLAPTDRRRAFIATGTGLAPFAPMFEQLKQDGTLGDAELYFGCRSREDDITGALNVLPAVTVCTSRDDPPEGGFSGRVTQALEAAELDAGATDFYLCGSAAMVADVTRVLQRRGATRILTEPY